MYILFINLNAESKTQLGNTLADHCSAIGERGSD